ncbi:MAG: ABC transporter permease [Treponema sp.]|nr:ABC transporter permease [Treponema sp.]
MNYKWIWFIAARYIFRRQKKSPSSVLSILGIATGVLALIVIIAVMNGFQLGFIESILEISSYHMRVGPLAATAVAAATTVADAADAALDIPGVEAAVPFREFQALVRGRRGGQHAVLVRALPADALQRDAGMKRKLVFENGFFDLTDDLDDKRKILLGAELIRRLGLRMGDEVTLFSIPSLFAAGNSAASGGDDDDAGLITFTIAGVFRTGFYEYDSGWAFVGMESAAPFSDTGPVLGIKLKNRFSDQRALELARAALETMPGAENAAFTSWRDYNRSFFGALRTEKLFMFILVGLIFIVVALNIFQAQRRTVLEHREDIGLLRAVGGGDRAVRLIFVCDGAIIGLSGAVLGLVPGLLIASHITAFFTVLENIVNSIIHIVNNIVNIFGVAGAGSGNFSFFSPAVFYIKEIPSRIIPQEAVLIFMFGFFSALAAAWFASRAISRTAAAEVLRYE